MFTAVSPTPTVSSPPGAPESPTEELPSGTLTLSKYSKQGIRSGSSIFPPMEGIYKYYYGMIQQQQLMAMMMQVSFHHSWKSLHPKQYPSPVNSCTFQNQLHTLYNTGGVSCI